MKESPLRAYDSCDLAADYSRADSTPVLPFLITLNLTDSRLTPAAGENQRFCYDVTGVGRAGEDYADLDRLILGVCEEITAADIAAVTVIVDGQEQQVDLGPTGNVALRTAEDPDPESGCTGLAFYFPLSREDSQMQLCFELTEPRPIGATAVCVSGGGLTLNDLSVCGPACESPEQSVTAYYRASVCAPVSVTPYAVAGEPEISLCGEAEISLGDDCEGGGQCGFTIYQQLCVTVPVSFGVMTEAGTAQTECLAAGGPEVCESCGNNEEPEEEGVITRTGYCG